MIEGFKKAEFAPYFIPVTHIRDTSMCWIETE